MRLAGWGKGRDGGASLTEVRPKEGCEDCRSQHSDPVFNDNESGRCCDIGTKKSLPVICGLACVIAEGGMLSSRTIPRLFLLLGIWDGGGERNKTRLGLCVPWCAELCRHKRGGATVRGISISKNETGYRER